MEKRNVEPKENGYDLLGKAIILQAVQDYVRAKRRYEFAKYDLEAKEVMQEAKEFLLSEEAVKYTDINIMALMENIDKSMKLGIELALNDLF